VKKEGKGGYGKGGGNVEFNTFKYDTIRYDTLTTEYQRLLLQTSINKAYVNRTIERTIKQA